MNIIYHLKLVYRNFINQRPYSFLNLIGLSIGLCITFVALLYVTEETGYDTFHKNSNGIYRLLIQRPLDGSDMNPNISPKIAKILNDKIPEITNSFSYLKESFSVKTEIKENEKVYRLSDTEIYATPEIVDVLSFEVIEGDLNAFKTDPKTVIISEKYALEYFKNVFAVGKTLTINNTDTYTVGAIYKDFPKKSSIKVELIVPIVNSETYQSRMKSSDLIGRGFFYSYLLIDKNVKIESIIEKSKAIVNEALPKNDDIVKYKFQKLQDIHLHSDDVVNEFTNGSYSKVIFYVIIGVLALLISLMNFILLYTAIVKKRLKELVIRRVNGLSTLGLIKMFLLEAFIISVVSSVLALVFADILVSEFNRLTFSFLSFNLSGKYEFIGCLFILIITISMLVCLWLFKYTNKYNAVEIFNGGITVKKTMLKNGAIAVQLIVAIVMLVFSIGFYKQLYFMIHADKGYCAENLLAIQDKDLNTLIVREELLKSSLIKSVAIGNTIPSNRSTHYTISKSFDAKDEYKAEAYTIDENFIPIYQLKMVLGENFSKKSARNEVILNETAVRVLGLKNPIGKRIDHGVVVGVVKDFNSNSLKKDIGPIIFSYVKKYSKVSGYLTIKYVKENKEAAEKFVLSVLDKQSPNHNVDLNVLDKTNDTQYDSEEKLQIVIFTATGITIFITILGLIGMSLFKTQQKTKEIGIRKVNGATISEIMIMLNKDFIKWVVVSFIIACPFAYYALQKWLENFAYKTTLSWWVFALAGLFTLIIALLTVSWQTYRAATKNPVESLRDE